MTITAEEITAPILSSVLSSGLIDSLFGQIFPVGSSVNVPIEAISVEQGPLTMTLCPRGCGARVTFRRVVVQSDPVRRFPIQVKVTIDASVMSIVSGSRAPLPLVTTGGDLAIDLDTSRGRTDLRFQTSILFGSPRTPNGYFRVNTFDLPPPLRISGLTVDIGEIVPMPGFELEADDLQFSGTSISGRAASHIIRTYQEQYVPYMRAIVRHMLNSLLCARFGTRCPERPLPPIPMIGLGLGPSSVVVASAVVASILGIVWWKKRRKNLGGLL